MKGESRAGELSEREKEVLIMLAWGYSNKEIAGQLKLSVKTVETYKLRIGEKLGLRSRTEDGAIRPAAGMVERDALSRHWTGELNAGSTPGGDPGFQLLNVREFPDARIHSSPTVQAKSLWAILTTFYGTNFYGTDKHIGTDRTVGCGGF